ncbi:uncharacterized protein LOC114516216 [Dendronephthya gigantea]|uniref:uncharacterized protein LOC114516216 n=1 Tax=Dendronephthya gigantea TaxID=151771 RepID=UPI00106CA2D6|nr:uncharacterized protein LOC114516216 [Dendronephthya gigantea]XP_028391434.1 uncharacterized protein LOC114516216 [Dendronephthya gigantea]XP_028391435.1 uncharacterized protein LOC114516216 [Dendronephthya gigantea]XP_028391436.1 uncharacterized protein LOC114516216 [Dendronephthya gigantea]
MLIITHRMSEPVVEWVGSSCGKHGAYTFYKGFKITTNGESREYLLGDFYFIRNSKDRPICIAEFQLLWHDANTDNKLASARLYFRPESTPGGRQGCHGKDELLYTDEKVVIKCRDMVNLEYDGTGWSYGVKAISEIYLQEVAPSDNIDSEDTKKFRLLKRKPKTKKMVPKERTKIVILSFPAYCRFKSLLKKLFGGLVMTKMAMKAFGGVLQANDSTWVSFSRDCFHHPGLTKFDMFCQNKAPVLKGRPRKKKMSKRTVSKDGTKQNTANVDQQTANAVESSDDNQTDTSETSSVQELPCPPKLVANIKEEKPFEIGVIRSVKQENDCKLLAIPPVPRLVKIEREEPSPNGQFRPFTEPAMMYSGQISSHHMEKTDPLKMLPSSSVISSGQCEFNGQTTREKCIEVTVDENCSLGSSATIHPSLVSHAATITTNHHIQPRMSTIIRTPIATQEEATKNEARVEQPLKRKRGRPPGKSNKCLKLSEMKIAPKTSLIDDDEVQIKIEIIDDNNTFMTENEEYSPEPQSEEEREFMKNLKIFMRKRGSPIEKIPALGFRKINLFKMYEVTRSLGGYDQVTNKRLWRRVYSEVGGAPSITSAATNSRRHYEKLLLPYERYTRGEEYLLDGKSSDSQSPSPDRLISPHKDKNGNVVSQNESFLLSTNKQEKQSHPGVTILDTHSNSIVRQPMVKQSNMHSKSINIGSEQNEQLTGCKPSITAVISQHDSRLKPVVSRVKSQKDVRLKPAVTLGMQDTRFKPVGTAEGSHQKDGVPSSQQHNVSGRLMQDRQNISHLTTTKPQNKGNTIHQDRTSHSVVKTEPTVSYQRLQERRSVVSYSSTQHHYNKPADSPLEIITRGSRSSPITMYSTNTDNLSPTYTANFSYDSQQSARQNTYTSERVSADPIRRNTKDCITEGYPVTFVPHKKIDGKTSAEFERKPKYLPHYDPVNEFSVPNEYHVEESREMRKHARGDEILVTNVIPGKRAHSPRDVMFSVPVFQPSHYPHGGFELYDLPNTFPVRASSRIFMPHQVFPAPSHPGFPPYTPHIIATIGTDPNTLYQLPIPGYYQQEIAYPMDILHS